MQAVRRRNLGRAALLGAAIVAFPLGVINLAFGRQHIDIVVGWTGLAVTLAALAGLLLISRRAT